MTKRIPKKNHSPVFVNESGKRTRTHTTTQGVVVTISAMPPLMPVEISSLLKDEWVEYGRIVPEKPTYTILTAIGETETHEHDEKTIQSNPEAKQAWDHWQAEKRAFDREFGDRTIRSLIIDCLEFEIDPQWDKKNKAKKITLPEDEYARKLFYARTYVLGGAEDYVTLRKISSELSGVPEQQANAVRDSFQREMEDPNGTAPRKPESETG